MNAHLPVKIPFESTIYNSQGEEERNEMKHNKSRVILYEIYNLKNGIKMIPFTYEI